jgi:hypothetical protein
MAVYQFGEDENVEESMRAILELAGPHEDREARSGIQYRAGVGPAGAVEIPDELHEQWTKLKADHDAEKASEADNADADADSDEGSDDDGSEEPKTTGRTSSRKAAKE